MDIIIEFTESAFRHKVTEEDIRHVFLNPLFDGITDDGDDKYLRIGFDHAGNLLEVLYNERDDHRVNVFHAMKCRSIYYHLLNP